MELITVLVAYYLEDYFFMSITLEHRIRGTEPIFLTLNPRIYLGWMGGQVD